MRPDKAVWLRSFPRMVFVVAGIYGLITLLPMYFMEARIGVDSPPAITHPEFFYGFLGVALAWQGMFLVIAADPMRYRWAMVAAAAEKIGFGIPSLILYSQGRLDPSALPFALLDLSFALLFGIAFVVTRTQCLNGGTGFSCLD